MNKYDLTYYQTPAERYRSGMNDTVADLVESFPGIRLIGSAGGSPVTNTDDRVADQTFTVEGTQGVIRSLAMAIEREINRDVEIHIIR